MKKIKFLNGISAVFALAVVALATTLTSCEKEEFNVNVTPTNAQAVISPIVLAIEDGVTTDVTGQATIAPAELTFTGNPTLAAKSVAITVYDLSDGSIINGASITENGAAITSNPFVIEAGSDGKIAAATRTFAATKDEYLSGEGQATVPALNKGQFALIPVSIFLQQELNAAEDVFVDHCINVTTKVRLIVFPI